MNKDIFSNSHITEILRQMQEERKRNISLPNEEVIRQMQQLKQNVSSSAAELIHDEEERRRRIPGSLLNNNISHVDKISEILKPFHLERPNLMSSSLSAMFESHTRSLLDFRETLGKAMLPDISSAHSIAIDSIKGQMSRHTSSIAQNFMESVQFKDLFKMTQFDAAKVFQEAVSTFLPSQKDLISSIAALQPSWKASNIAFDAIEGMTGLMSLRNAVATNP